MVLVAIYELAAAVYLRCDHASPSMRFGRLFPPPDMRIDELHYTGRHCASPCRCTAEEEEANGSWSTLISRRKEEPNCFPTAPIDLKHLCVTQDLVRGRYFFVKCNWKIYDAST